MGMWPMAKAGLGWTEKKTRGGLRVAVVHAGRGLHGHGFRLAAPKSTYHG